MRKAAEIVLTAKEKSDLEAWQRSGSTEQRLALRAQIILGCAAVGQTTAVAGKLGVMPYVVSKWRKRFAAGRMAGLQDTPRSGKPRTYTAETEKRVLAQLDQPPPKGYAQWNGPLLAQSLQDVSEHHVWRVLRNHGIQLQRRRSWCLSTDPEFAPKAADIVGLYLDPPANAIVLAVDEKPHIQALERAQGWLRMPNGKALTGFSHEYARHGTSTLFAALEVATGLVQAGHYSRRRRREFLDFMNEVVANHPEKEIHVVLDNLNTHKPKQDRWLARHPNVHLHFTPTHASWLNQIEVWFSLLSRQALRGASFRSTIQLRRAIDDFIHAHNRKAAPFEWRKTFVTPSRLKHSYSELRN
jgi:transposase